jgi:hypothetical protein
MVSKLPYGKNKYIIGRSVLPATDFRKCHRYIVIIAVAFPFLSISLARLLQLIILKSVEEVFFCRSQVGRKPPNQEILLDSIFQPPSLSIPVGGNEYLHVVTFVLSSVFIAIKIIYKRGEM